MNQNTLNELPARVVKKILLEPITLGLNIWRKKGVCYDKFEVVTKPDLEKNNFFLTLKFWEGRLGGKNYEKFEIATKQSKSNI